MIMSFNEVQDKLPSIVIVADGAPTKASKGGPQVGSVLLPVVPVGLRPGTQAEWKQALETLGKRSNDPAAAEAELRPSQRTPAIPQNLQQLDVRIGSGLRSRMLLRFSR